MKLIIDQVEISNFKSFAGPSHLLDLGSAGVGLHSIKGDNQLEPRLGSNGAGKSTVLGDPICWCLYGKTPSGLKNPDIKPWTGKKNTVVTVYLTIDGTDHQVTRKANPNSVEIDGEEVSSDVVVDFLGISYGVFTNTILLGQSQPLFFDLSPRAKMDLFVDVLELDKWDRRSAAASEEAKEVDRDLIEIDAEISGQGVYLVEMTSSIEAATRRSEQWVSDQEDRVSKYKSQRKEYSTELEVLDKRRAEADVANDSAETELKSVRAELEEARTARHKAQRAVDQIEGHNIFKKQRIQQREKEIVGKGDKCPVCGQSTKGTMLKRHRDKILTEIEGLREEIEKGVPRKVLAASESSGEKVKRFVASERNFSVKAEKTRTILNVVEPRVFELKALIKGLNQSIDERTEEQNPHRDQISILKRKLVKTKRECKEAKQDRDKLARMLERAKYWVKGFKDIRLYIVDEVLQELELTVNTLLDELGLAKWQVTFSVEKETKAGTVTRGLNVMIASAGNTAARWEAWSGGEGQRLRLIGALALSEVLLNHAGIQPSLEILDEPTRHLSSEGVVDLCEYLADRAAQLGRQVWYIDHQATESSMFTTVRTVVKDKEGSHLVGDLVR